MTKLTLQPRDFSVAQVAYRTRMLNLQVLQTLLLPQRLLRSSSRCVDPAPAGPAVPPLLYLNRYLACAKHVWKYNLELVDE